MATKKYFSEIDAKTTPADADIYLLADSEDLSSGNPIHKKITHANVKASLIIDEDTLASNLDTKAPTQQSVKAYVDTGLATKSATSHTHTASEITDFDAEVTNNDAVSANTAKTSFPGFGTLASDYSVTLATVATSGAYSDLSGTPTIPTTIAELDTTVTGAQLNAIKTKTDHITVTQAVDLDQMETDIAALANGMVYKGDWDASAGAFPGTGSAQTGWFYYVSVGGTVGGVVFDVGDNVVATTDNASTTVYTGNWSKHDQTDAVQSVVGLTGSISKSGLLVAINVEDGADVTDTANVAAAGALMDSEVDADIKTLSLPANTTITTFGASLVGDIDASTARATLGLGNVDNTSDSTKNSATATLTNKTINGDNNTLSNLDIGNEVDWAVATDVADRGSFSSGDKLLIFQSGVGLRKIDYDDLPSGGGGTGDVTGPASSTDNAIARLDGITGKIIQNSGVTIDDSNNLSGVNNTTGSDASFVTGTAGTSGHLASWNADGDLIDGPTPPTGIIVGTTDTQTLTNKTLTSPAVTSPTGIVKGDVGLGNVDNTSDATKNSATATLTNKTISGDSNTLIATSTDASSATPTPTGGSNINHYSLTALAANATFSAPSGTPAEGNRLTIRIKDNGTSRTLAYNAIYRAIGVTLPVATVISKTIYLGCLYNSTDSKRDVIAVGEEE